MNTLLILLALVSQPDKQVVHRKYHDNVYISLPDHSIRGKNWIYFGMEKPFLLVEGNGSWPNADEYKIVACYSLEGAAKGKMGILKYHKIGSSIVYYHKTYIAICTVKKIDKSVQWTYQYLHWQTPWYSM